MYIENTMNTGYKTRTWWALRGLSYAHSLVILEDEGPSASTTAAFYAQLNLWLGALARCMRCAFAVAGCEALTPSHEYLASKAEFAHLPYEPVYPVGAL